MTGVQTCALPILTSFTGPRLTGEKKFEVEDMGYWRRVPPDGTFAVTYVLLCVE